ILDVRAQDSNPSGSVPLLQRADATKPMVGVDLDGMGDDRLTLAEIAQAVVASRSPVKVLINAKAPPTELKLSANVAGTQAAGGKVTVSWPDVSRLTGFNSLSDTADADFSNILLPFSFDPNNP